MNLSDFLKKDRENQGLTQSEYAKLLGINRGTLSHLETNRLPSPKTSKKLVSYFNKPLSELLGEQKIATILNLETTNMLIDSFIKKGEIKKGFISEKAKKAIWSTLELEIDLKCASTNNNDSDF